MVINFTAAEARELAGPTVEEIVNDAIEEIKKAAQNKKRSLRLNSDFWTKGGYSTTPDWLKAVKLLEGLGYDVKYHYEERQFVDHYTLVSW